MGTGGRVMAIEALHQSFVSPFGPPPAGPYAHAVSAGGTVYLAGHTPRDPETGAVAATFAEQAHQTFANLSRSAAVAGASLSQAVRVTVYLTSFDHFDELNAICAANLKPPYPARTTIVAGLRGILIEIEAVLWTG